MTTFRIVRCFAAKHKRFFFSQEMHDDEYNERKKHSKSSTLPLLQSDFDVTEYRNVFKRDFVTKWNKEMKAMTSNKMLREALEWIFDKTVSLADLKNLAFHIVASIDGLHEDRMTINATKLAHAVLRIIEDNYMHFDAKIELMCDLSILEFSLIVAMKHHSDIYDNDPFNFEIILTRLHKFQNSGECVMEKYDRDVVLKAFDVLKVGSFSSSLAEREKEIGERGKTSNRSDSRLISAFGTDCDRRPCEQGPQGIPNAQITRRQTANR